MTRRGFLGWCAAGLAAIGLGTEVATADTPAPMTGPSLRDLPPGAGLLEHVDDGSVHATYLGIDRHALPEYWAAQRRRDKHLEWHLKHGSVCPGLLCEFLDKEC